MEGMHSWLQGVVVGTGTLGIPTARMNFAYDDPGVQDHISNIREMRTAGLIPGPADDVKPDDSVSVRRRVAATSLAIPSHSAGWVESHALRPLGDAMHAPLAPLPSVATGVRSLDVGSVAESAAMRKLAELEEQLKSEVGHLRASIMPYGVQGCWWRVGCHVLVSFRPQRERAMNLQSELDRMKVASTSGGSQAPGAELRGARGDGAPSRVGQPRASGAASTAASRPGASRPGQTGEM